MLARFLLIRSKRLNTKYDESRSRQKSDLDFLFASGQGLAYHAAFTARRDGLY